MREIDCGNTSLAKEVPTLEDVQGHQRLVACVRKLGELREYTESSVNAIGSLEAEEILIKNIPTLGFIVNGDLKGSENDNKIGARVASLPLEVVNQTQDRIDLLLSTFLAVETFASAKRLQTHLPIIMPKTRAGFVTLKHVASVYHKTVPLSTAGLVHTKEVESVLTQLDRKVAERAQVDQDALQTFTFQAREQAERRLASLQAKNSPHLKEIRSVAVEKKMSTLRHEQINPGRNRSRFELLANRIIETDGLTGQSDAVKELDIAALEQAKEAVFNTLARKRAIRRVISMLGSDPLLRGVIAKRHRMSPDELLGADEATKTLAANNALNSKHIVVSVEDRKVFSGGSLLLAERRKLEEALDDPLIFIAGLFDEELTVIRNGIPKISEAKSVFDLAKERLRRRLEGTITDDDLLDILTRQTIRELLSTRSSMAVDLTIRDLGIDSAFLLRDPSLLSQSENRIVENALKYLRFDSPPLRLPNVEVEGYEQDESLHVLEVDHLRCLTEKNIIDLLERLVQSPDIYGVRIKQREEVKIYMVDEKAREILSRVSRFLADLSKISDTLILPETEDEMSCLLTMIVDAIITGKAITLVTPICPDWSRDGEGRYDFKSLGGNESFIAKKLFTHGPEMLAVFAKYQIPFKGVLLFADWGLETEIDAKDTYGQELSAEDVQMCFRSTVAATDEYLKTLQVNKEVGHLFAEYSIVSMKEFLEKRLNIPQVQARLAEFFTNDRRGRVLLDTLAAQSYKINRARLRLTEEENRGFALQNLVEYAMVGQSIGPHSILVACESRTSSRSYNLPRQKHENIPVFFVKGKEEIDRGVNIL